MADEAIRNKIFAYKPLFQSTLNLLSEIQKEVLYVIAKEGKAIQITSGSFNKKHGLLSPSSIQTSVKQLLDKDIITVDNKIYSVYDRFFGLWLKDEFGTGWNF